ncbi:MAG: hypothetical protein AAF657_12670 [Acidobacteriota bacterium]
MNSKDSGLPSTPGEVDLEDIAALADGRLEGAERQRVIERLAEDEASYEIFQEVLRFQEDEEQRTEAPEVSAVEEPDEREVVVPIDRGRKVSPRRWWMPVVGVAAAAMLALVVGIEQVPMDARSLIETSIQAGTEVDELDSDWYSVARTTYRGVGGSEDARLEFQAGLEIAGIHIALITKDIDQASTLAGRLAVLLRNEAWFLPPVGAEIQAGDIEARLVAGEISSEGALALTQNLEQTLEENLFESPYFDYGRWVEAGRLAATSGEPEYFSGRVQRRLLRQLEKVGLDEDVKQLRALVPRKDSNLDPIYKELTRLAKLRGTSP